MNVRKPSFIAATILAALAITMPAHAENLSVIDERLELLEQNAQRQLDAIRALRTEVEEARALNTPTTAQGQSTQATPHRLTEAEKYQALIWERLSFHWLHPYLSGDLQSYSATVEIHLLPTGEMLNARIIRSSGINAYDNSVLRAVRSVRRFPIPIDRDMFEQYFRRFTVEFTPERLR